MTASETFGLYCMFGPLIILLEVGDVLIILDVSWLVPRGMFKMTT